MTQIASNELLSSALTAVGAVAEVLVPGDDGYAGSAATLFADGTPDLVVRPHDADVAAAYPPGTYRRLAAVKRRYDPANVFRRTHNILPARS